MLIVAKNYNSIFNIIQESKKSDQFEIDVVEYLNDTYGDLGLKFIRVGGSDSTKSDIFIKVTNSDDRNNSKYIECKMARAQAAHVTLNEVKDGSGNVTAYEYQGNLDEHNEDDIALKNIILFINEKLGSGEISKDHPYLRIGKNQEPVQSNFDKAIIRHYKKLGVDYIASGSSGKNPIIIKLQNVGTYFDITATFRVLPSGSRDVPKMYVKDIITDNSFEKYTFFTGPKNDVSNLLPVSVSEDTLLINGYPADKKFLNASLYIKTNNQLDDRIPVKLHNGKTVYLVFQSPINGYSKVRFSSYKGPDSEQSKPSINFSVYLTTDKQPDKDKQDFEQYLNNLKESLNE